MLIILVLLSILAPPSAFAAENKEITVLGQEAGSKELVGQIANHIINNPSLFDPLKDELCAKDGTAAFKKLFFSNNLEGAIAGKVVEKQEGLAKKFKDLMDLRSLWVGFSPLLEEAIKSDNIAFLGGKIVELREKIAKWEFDHIKWLAKVAHNEFVSILEYKILEPFKQDIPACYWDKPVGRTSLSPMECTFSGGEFAVGILWRACERGFGIPEAHNRTTSSEEKIYQALERLGQSYENFSLFSSVFIDLMMPESRLLTSLIRGPMSVSRQENSHIPDSLSQERFKILSHELSRRYHYLPPTDYVKLMGILRSSENSWFEIGRKNILEIFLGLSKYRYYSDPLDIRIGKQVLECAMEWKMGAQGFEIYQSCKQHFQAWEKDWEWNYNGGLISLASGNFSEAEKCFHNVLQDPNLRSSDSKWLYDQCSMLEWLLKEMTHLSSRDQSVTAATKTMERVKGQLKQLSNLFEQSKKRRLDNHGSYYRDYYERDSKYYEPYNEGPSKKYRGERGYYNPSSHK